MGRRWLHPSSGLWALLLCAAVAAATLGANPFKGETITPFDVLVSQRAWEFVDPAVEVRSYQRSDILNALLPHWEMARTQLHAGQMPLWNDKVAGGGTFLSLSTNLFTPAFVIFAATPDPALGFYLGTLFNLTLAGLGMYLFLRRHVGPVAAIVGALTFELCGFNAAWLYWPHVLTLIWAPWVLWAIDRCAHKPGAGSSLLVAATSALVWLGGFPFLSVLVMEMAGLYTLILIITQWRAGEKPWRFAAWCFAGTVLGLLLAALPILGLVYWLQQFDLGYREGRGSYLDISHWKQLFPPWAYQVQRVEQTMYVGAAMMALAAVALVAMVVRRRAWPLPLFGVLVVAIAAGLVFELWPMWLVGWLPGMTFNSWSRAIGLLDIGLIVLGAVGFDLLWRAGAAKSNPLRITMAVIAVAQVVEISMFFRDFNGPVDARYYFPRTATIEYVRERAGPFDYVITDRAFLMSGTLGPYGQREWLAHYFRSPALQDALHEMAKRPFNSHRASASRFPASDIKYDSPAMADYNVRYALIDSRHGPDSPERIPAPSPADGKHKALPAMPMHSYVQHFHLQDTQRLLGVSVRLATYRQKQLPGRVTLRVLDAAGHIVGEGVIPAASVRDNAYADFPLREPVMLQGGNHAFSLGYEPEEPGEWRLTAWAYTAPDPGAPLEINGEASPGVLQYQLLVPGAGGSEFRRVFTADGTAVLENGASPGGPYFVADVGGRADADAARDVQIESYRADAFTLRYRGHASGYVVVPMSINREWHVTVNGAPVEPSTKDGVMPAVPVSAPATIRFEYRPAVARWILPWLVALAAALLAMGLVDRWTRPGR